MTIDRLKLLGVLAFLTVLGFFCADITAKALAAQAVLPPKTVVRVQQTTSALSQTPGEGQFVARTASLLAPPPSPVTPVGTAPVTGGQTTADNNPWDQWLQDPQQNMTLIGTMVGSDLGIAVVSANNQQYAIELGEHLGTWRVIGVSDVDVTFESSQHTVTHLTLPMLSSTSPTPHAPAFSYRQPLRPSGPGLTVQMRGGTRILQRSQIESVLQSPGGVTQNMRFDTVAQDGKPYGVKVNYLDPSNLFYSLGLRQGDVIKSINGQDLRNQDDGIKAYLMLQNENALDIKVERNGRPMDIPVEIQ